MQPSHLPVGLQLARTSRIVRKAFDDALDGAGGSLPVWLVLLNLKTRPIANQRELAHAVGIGEATLTHHLNAMDRQGLITRHRDPANRRVHRVELTADGEAAFARLRAAAMEFDRRLRAGLTDDELGSVDRLLDRLAPNVGPAEPGSPPWAGLTDKTPSRRPPAPAPSDPTTPHTRP